MPSWDTPYLLTSQLQPWTMRLRGAVCGTSNGHCTPSPGNALGARLPTASTVLLCLQPAGLPYGSVRPCFGRNVQEPRAVPAKCTGIRQDAASIQRSGRHFLATGCVACHRGLATTNYEHPRACQLPRRVAWLCWNQVCASRPVPTAARPSACGLVARACGGVAVTFRPRLGRTVPYTPVSKILVRALKTSWVALPAVAASVWIPYTRISLFQAAVHQTGEQTAAKPAACLPAARPAAGPSVSCSNPPPVPTTCSACCRSGCQLPGPTKRAAEGGWHAFPPTCSCPLQATLTPLGAACA